MRTPWVVLVLMLLVPASASAATDTLLTATTVQAAGDVTLEGTLAAHLQYGGPLPSGAPQGFFLAAARLTVETMLKQTAHVAGVEAGPLSPTYAREPFIDAEVRALESRPMDYVLVQPLPGAPPPRVHQNTTCATASASAEPDLTANRGPPDDARRRVEVHRTIAVSSCGAAWTFAGTFLVLLWEWDITVSTADGTQSFASGADTPDGAGVAEHRLLFLEVRDGKMVLPGEAPAAAHTHLAAATLRASEVGLADAEGLVPDGGGLRWVAREFLRVGGAPEVTAVWRANDVVAAAVGGRVAWAYVGSEPLTWSTPADAWGNAWPGVVGGAVAAVVVLVAVWALRMAPRRRPRAVRAARWRARASGLLAARRPRRAARAAGRAVRLDPHHGDGYALRALALASVGRYAAALADHDRAHRRLAGRERGLNALEAARVQGLRGRGAEAAHWLTIAAREGACALSEAVTEPDFGPVRDAPPFRRVLRDAVPGFRLAP